MWEEPLCVGWHLQKTFCNTNLKDTGCVGSGLFLILHMYNPQMEGRSALMILSANLIIGCNLNLFNFVDEPDHTVMDEHSTD